MRMHGEGPTRDADPSGECFFQGSFFLPLSRTEIHVVAVSEILCIFLVRSATRGKPLAPGPGESAPEVPRTRGNHENNAKPHNNIHFVIHPDSHHVHSPKRRFPTKMVVTGRRGTQTGRRRRIHHAGIGPLTGRPVLVYTPVRCIPVSWSREQKKEK